jgi:hypothetical protein
MMKTFVQTYVLFFLTFTFSGATWAHGETVAQLLGKPTSGATATDLWAVTCTKGPEKPGAPIVTPTRLVFQVRDEAPVRPAVISIQAIKGTLKSPVYTDAKDGDAVYGPASFASLYGGAGTYVLKITKSASTAGTETYRPRFHCWTNSNGHSAISFRLIQNQ